jgi:hypothetical protein
MRRNAPRAVLALLAALLLASCGGVELGSAVRRLSGDGATRPQVTAPDDARTAAVKDAIDRANRAQAEAFNTGSASLMRATATASFYARLEQINRELAAAGVASIELVAIEYDDVSIAGATATVTTYETWRTRYGDGTTEESTARNDYTLVLDGPSWRIETNDQAATGVEPTPLFPDTTTPSSPARVSDTSTNWSGYAATGGTFTSVTGSWKVPTVASTTSGSDATWVGIGGLNTVDLIQAGTQATVSGGQVFYQAWFEMLPAASVPISLSVGPGDSVTVTITQRNDLDWLIEVKNNSTGGRWSRTVQYRSSRSSAEWVQEAPSSNRGLLPLTDFGKVTFTDASAVRDGASRDLAELDAKAITMVNGLRQPLAVPSEVSADGDGFTVTRTENPNTQSLPGQRRRRSA